MARSHHRKKHKEHLRQFKHSHDGSTTSERKATSKAVVIFGILGALIGFAVGYFGSNDSLVWSGIGMVVGAITGYYLGRNVDRGRW